MKVKCKPPVTLQVDSQELTGPAQPALQQSIRQGPRAAVATAGVMSTLKERAVAGEARGGQGGELELPACPQHSTGHPPPPPCTESTRH